MDARQAEHPKPSACRNLFGPVNHEELTRDLEKHRRDMEEASQRKWNFDFQNHKPLEGKYEWQEVEKGSLPEFYYRPPRPPKGACKVPAQEGQDVSGSRQAVPLVGSQANSEDTHLVDQKTDPSASQTGLAEQCAGIRKRPATDGEDTFRVAKCLSVCLSVRPPGRRFACSIVLTYSSFSSEFWSSFGGANFVKPMLPG
jgi:cyclin-dependent kinase inhibitor 1B